MTSPDEFPRASLRGARLLTGLSRAQERRLRSLWLEEWGLRVVARCGSAAQLLDVIGRGEGDVVLVDEDLHRFDSGHGAALWQASTPLVALVREPQDLRWRDVPGLLLPLDAEMPAVLDALERAAHGERASRLHKPSSGAQEATTPTKTGVVLPTRLQVLALWSGRGHAGSTLLATSSAAILGSATATVLVDLDTTGAAVGVHLDDGHQGRVRSSLADLINGDLDSHEAWQRELGRALQPLGPFALGTDRYSADCHGDASA